MRLETYLKAIRRHAAAEVLFGGAFAVGLAPNADGDLWWHMAAGREIARTGMLPSVDSFSVSSAGRPWVDVHWLFQLAAYEIHRFGGLTALVLVKCLLLAFGALILQGTVQREIGPRLRWFFVAGLLAALFLARHLVPVRPVVVTLLLLAVFFRALERFRHGGAAQALWPLPVLQVLWANVQGLFALGPVLVAAYLLAAAFSNSSPSRPPASSRGRWGFLEGRPATALLATLALCGLACCATPYGLSALVLPLRLLARLLPSHMNVYAANVAENIPPLALEQAMPGEFWHLRWFVALLALSFFAAGRRVALAHAFLAAALVPLALAANRNVLLLYWLATPIAFVNLARGIRARVRVAARLRRSRGLRLLSYALVVGPLALIGVAFLREPALAQPAPFRFPVQSARILAEGSEGGGTVFAADNYGGYLIWELFPRYQPYIDTRLVLRTPQEFAEYLAVADHPERFEDFERRHGFDYVLLPTAYPDRYLNLAGYLYTRPDWKLVFTDGTETLFARASRTHGEGLDVGATATTDAILRGLDDRFSGSAALRSAARVQLATLEIALGEYAQAERVLTTTADASVDALRARVKVATGDLIGAEKLGETLLQRDRDDVRTLNLMAVVSLRRGQATPALHFLRQALAVDPFDSEAGKLLATLEEHAQAQ